MAGVASMMCSYSSSLYVSLEGESDLQCIRIDQVNGTYACENDKTMNDIAKREYGFQGCKSQSSCFGACLLTGL